MQFGYIPQILEIWTSRAGADPDIIDLLHGSDGVFISSWEHGVNPDKGGGVWEDSPMHEGGTLIHSVIGNADESFSGYIFAYNPAECWRILNKIQSALEQARAYSKGHRDTYPISLVVQVAGLDIQYALAVTGVVRPTGMPFQSMSPHSQYMSTLGFALAVNRDAYQDSLPGRGTAIPRGNIILGGNDLYYGDALTSGVTDYSATRKVFVTGKRQTQVITHIYGASGSSWTANNVGTLPHNLTGGAEGDARYVGCDEPFDNLVFNVGSPISIIAGTHELEWEYWGGAEWKPLPGVADNTEAFTVVGTQAAYWGRVTDWASADLSTIATGGPGVTKYWMRIRLSVLTGTISVIPTQTTRYVYTAIHPSIDIRLPETEDGGIASLARIKIYKDRAGELDDAQLPTRVIVGLRSYDDGDTFVSHINMHTGGNPAGITVTAGTHATSVTASEAPTGTAIRYSPTGSLNIWDTRANISFTNAASRHYSGRYRAYLRCRKSSGTGTMTVKLEVRPSPGSSVIFESQELSLADTNDWAILDFGMLPLDPFVLGESSGSIEIAIAVKTTNNTPTLTIYDLILIPIREWIASLEIPGGTEGSLYLASNGYFDVDSVSDLRRKTAVCHTRAVTDDSLLAILSSESNGPAILQPGKKQKLYFFAYDKLPTPGNGDPTIPLNIEIQRVRRWRSIRA